MKQSLIFTFLLLFSVLLAQDSQPTDKPTLEEVKQFITEQSVGSVTFDGMFAGIEKLGPNTLEHLHTLVSDVDTDLRIRKNIPRAMGELGDKNAIAHLKEYQEDIFIEDEIKNEIAFALYALGETEYLDGVVLKLQQSITNLSQNPPPPEEHSPEEVNKQIMYWLRQLRELSYRIGKYEITCKTYEILNNIVPEATEWYNWACTLSLAGRLDESVEKLNKAYELKQFGTISPEDIERDGDLKNIRQHPGFQELLKKLREETQEEGTQEEETEEEENKE